MKSQLFIAGAFLFLVACSKSQDILIKNSSCENTQIAPFNSHRKSQELKNIIEKYISQGIPAVSLVIESKEEGFFSCANGISDLATKTPLKSCNTFRIASLTKTFMAVSIMQLVEKNKISLNQKINEILSADILSGLAKANETTVQELLNHTSGIPNYDDNIKFKASILNTPGKLLTVNDRLNFAKEQKGVPDEIIQQHGSIYSNTNYILLELILEKVTGISFEAYFIQNIINPLQLTNTKFGTKEPFPDGLASGYCDMYDNGKLREVNLFDANRWSGEACLISNAKDVYTFFKGLKDGNLVSISTKNKMTKMNLGILDEEFEGLSALGHDGQAIGYSSEMRFFPEKDLIIVMLANKGRISSDQSSIQDYKNLMHEIVSIHKQ